MTEAFVRFMQDTNKENYLALQELVFSNEDYQPYSEDLTNLNLLLQKEAFEEIVNYNNINVWLSPRAHIFKSIALDQLGRDKDATSEKIIAQKILEGITLTGDGSKEQPYKVTRITDERDVLSYVEEEMKMQNLINEDKCYYDVLTCQSGKEFYFDITIPYSRMIFLYNHREIESPLETASEKKWWQFWK